MQTKLYYSIFSGIIYEICADEVAILDAGQIPLIARPKRSCNKCYGRGYESRDPARGLYYMCSCMRKIVAPDYVPQNVQVPMEKFR
jgi:hypothetical protein